MGINKPTLRGKISFRVCMNMSYTFTVIFKHVELCSLYPTAYFVSSFSNKRSRDSVKCFAKYIENVFNSSLETGRESLFTRTGALPAVWLQGLDLRIFLFSV